MIRLHYLFFPILVSLSLLCSAQTPAADPSVKATTPSVDRFVYAARDSVGVYKTALDDQKELPRVYLRSGDKVKVLDEQGGRMRVVLPDGTDGWSDKTLFKAEDNQRLYLDELKVLGFLDNPNPIYILDMSDEDYQPIRVAKDFIFERDFMTNFSKESFEWENEIYYYKDVDFKPEAVKQTFQPLINK